MYEKRTQPPLAHASFMARLMRHLLGAAVLVVVSLGVGIWGYMHYEHLPPIDAFLNASMLLGGMGPIHTPQQPGGKIFAGLYALYAGLVFVAAAAIVLTPVAHRALHKFHWDDKL